MRRSLVDFPVFLENLSNKTVLHIVCTSIASVQLRSYTSGRNVNLGNARHDDVHRCLPGGAGDRLLSFDLDWLVAGFIFLFIRAITVPR